MVIIQITFINPLKINYLTKVISHSFNIENILKFAWETKQHFKALKKSKTDFKKSFN